MNRGDEGQIGKVRAARIGVVHRDDVTGRGAMHLQGGLHGERRRAQMDRNVRRLGDETLVMAFNVSRGSRALAVPVETYLAEGSMWKDQWGASTARVECGRLTGLTLAPRSAVVLTEDGRG